MPADALVTLVATHWGRVTHICVGNITIIGSDNGLSPGRRHIIIWTNAGILLIGPLGTNFKEIVIGIQTFSVQKMHLKMSSVKWRPLCLGLNVLRSLGISWHGLASEDLKQGDNLIHTWCMASFTEIRAWIINYIYHDSLAPGEISI